MDYMTANDIIKIIPMMKKKEALNIIKKAQEAMEKKGNYVPKCRTKVALTDEVLKILGLKK